MKAWVPFDELVGTEASVEVAPFPSAGGRPDTRGVRFVALPHPFAAESLDFIQGVPDLQVVQLLSSGFDHVLGRIPPKVRLYNAPNLHAQPTAEVGMSLILASLNHVQEWAVNQQSRLWNMPAPRPCLIGKTVLIVGTGAVGEALGRMLAGFHVDLIRVARRERPGVAGVDHLGNLLPRADVVVLAAPLTEETRGLFGEEMLGAMRDGALLVNIARGPLVDTRGLARHLRAGRLRAALDVTDPEPLPSDHELWDCPGILISPHVGGDTADFRARAAAFVRDQVRRFAADSPLLNEVFRPG